MAAPGRDEVGLSMASQALPMRVRLKRVKADGGRVVVVHAQDQPLAVLKLLKLDRIFGL